MTTRRHALLPLAAFAAAATFGCSTNAASDARAPDAPAPATTTDGAGGHDGSAPLVDASPGPVAASDSGGAALPTRPGWTLAWHDEFDGSAIDLTKWSFDIGGTGWGNDEQQYYSDRPQNARVDGAGTLILKAYEEAYKGKGYSSARLTTKGKFSQLYGRFEARIKLPVGQGIWPSFWLVGANVDATPWPACGEVDIMENRGSEPSINHGSLHGPGYSAGDAVTAAYTLPGGKTFVSDFHQFAIEWEPAGIRFYVDDTLYATQAPVTLPSGKAWVYDHPFYINLNLAVGGIFPKYPDATTVFPQSLFIDYVRVYKR